MKIIICGKGGSGKSTVVALLANAMQQRGKRVLLVDADESNIGLYRMLGLDMPVPLMDNLGGKEGFREKKKNSGITLGGPSQIFPQELRLDQLPQDCMASSGRIQAMSIGKIHHSGEGCACPMGSLFRMFLSALKLEQQDLVIVDTAAGVEHFGRGLDKQCEHILCVVDPSYESMMMAKRVKKLAGELKLPLSILLNKVTPEVEKELLALKDVNIIGSLPDNRSILLHNLKGQTLDFEIPEIESVCDALEQ